MTLIQGLLRIGLAKCTPLFLEIFFKCVYSVAPGRKKLNSACFYIASNLMEDFIFKSKFLVFFHAIPMGRQCTS